MPRLLLAALLLAPMLARADLEPGLWELTISVSVAGVGALQPATRTQCLSAAEARDPSSVFGSDGGRGCSFSNQRDTGSEYSFSVACAGPVPVSGSGSVRYSGSTVSAQMELGGDAGGQKFSTTSLVAGRRLGPCH